MKQIKNLPVFDRLRSYFKNAGLYFTSSLLVAVVGILLNPFLAMNLSPEDYAVLGYYSSFNLLLIPLLHFCTLTYYSRQYYFIPEEKRDALGDTVLLTMNIIGLVSFAFFTSVFYIIHRKIGNSFPFFPYALFTFLQLYISNNSTFYTTKLRVTKQAKKFAQYSIIQCIVTNAIVILFVVYYKAGAEGKLIATLISTILFAIYAFKQSLHKWQIDKEILRSAIKFSFPLTISALFWYYLNGVDRLFLERVGDVQQLGIYNVGLSIAGYMQIFFTTINNTFEPDIYQSIAQKNKKKTYLLIITLVGVVIFFNLLFILFAPLFIKLITAGRYIASAPFARIIALGNITMACYYMVVKLIVGQGYVKGELLVRITGAALSVIVYYLLISKWQYVGAAWGQVLSFFMVSVIGLLYLIIKRKRVHHDA